jgi:hypothetical protein
MSQLFQDRKVENVLTDRDSHTRFTLFRLKDAEWKILDRKMRLARDIDEGLERHNGSRIVGRFFETPSR